MAASFDAVDVSEGLAWEFKTPKKLKPVKHLKISTILMYTKLC